MQRTTAATARGALMCAALALAAFGGAFAQTKAPWDKDYKGVLPGFMDKADDRDAALFALAAEAAARTNIAKATTQPD